MKRSTAILLILIALEAVVCGNIIARRLRQPAPVLPHVAWNAPSNAKELRELATAARSGSSEDWQRLAGAYLEQGLWSLAEIHFRQALVLDPENHAARFGMATCMDRTGRVQESTRVFQNLVQRIGGRRKLLEQYSRYQIGLNFLQQKQVDRAARSFHRNIDYPPAKYQLAKLLVRSGRLEEAVPLLEYALYQTPRSLNYLFLQYRAMKALDRQQAAWRAVDKLQRAAQPSSGHFGLNPLESAQHSLGRETHRAIGGSSVSQGNIDQSNIALLASKLTRTLSTVAGRHPRYVQVAMRLLELEVQRQEPNPQRIRALVERMHAFGQYNADLLRFAGVAAAVSGDIDTAIEFWRRALRMAPSVQLHRHLADAFEARGDSGRRDFHVARSFVLQGIALYRANQVPQAATTLERALELNPDDAQAWFYLAQSRRVLGQRTQARAAYERCLELNPNHGRARRQLERLDDQGSHAVTTRLSRWTTARGAASPRREAAASECFPAIRATWAES